MELVEAATFEAEEHILNLSWSHDGSRLAACPSEGPIAILNADGKLAASLDGHGLGNGMARFHPASGGLATCGTNGAVRFYATDLKLTREVALGRDWVERIAWSPDGSHLAAASGRRVVVLDEHGETIREFTNHKSTVCDVTWNPRKPDELVSVCDGGAHMWRLSEDEPFARFDWGGASLIVEWSPDGRWIVTGDQTPSVHLYDFSRDYPLHIQGFETKVKAVAFNSLSRQLATGGGRLVTLWPCTGKKGPEGAIPKQLPGHDGDPLALAWKQGADLLASGGSDGMLLLFEPGTSIRPRVSWDAGASIEAIAWHPAGDRIATGANDGVVTILDVR